MCMENSSDSGMALKEDIKSLVKQIQQDVEDTTFGESGTEQQRLLENVGKLQKAVLTPEQYVQKLRMQVVRLPIQFCLYMC